MNIRSARPADRERILEILIATARFTEDEVDAAIGLVDQGFTELGGSEYRSSVIEASDAIPSIIGYVCYGPTPRAEGVFDLYWIAVDPLWQKSGAGTMLLRFVEDEVRSARGRMLLIETSSKESYRPTVRFYEGCGYREITRIKDFYRVRDDKIVFCKTL
ncbi:MAG TPA: GNAT family N-acetyltransferase [Thermoanaerobaculia bacterium]|nr:GNAT family N-acetyltransferase [Thermoanaerobaculia bacterium]